MLDLEAEFSQTEEHNGITFTRLPNMPNIARVESLEDLELWKDREELGLNGLITTHPDDQQVAMAARDMTDYAHKNPEDFTPILHDNMVSELAVNMHSVIYQNAWSNKGQQADSPKSHPNVTRLPDYVQDIISVLSDTFVNTAEAKSTHGNHMPLYLRVNSDYPLKPHKHGEENPITQRTQTGDTITIALSGNGSVLYDDTLENSYKMQTGEIGLFDETMWHSADKYDESWEENPRANIILG